MAEQDDGQEKTEQATGKKVQDNREKGFVAKSVELSSFAVFSSGLLIIFAAKGFMSSQLAYLAKEIFNSIDTLTLNKTVVQMYAVKISLFFFITVAPVFVVIVLAALIVNISQTGFMFNTKALEVKPEKFNVVKGIKRIFFSAKSFVELAKSMIKLFLIAFFAYGVIEDIIIESITLPDFSVSAILNFMIDSAVGLLWRVSLVYAVFAFIDFAYQKYKYKKDLMMTKQEVKEENKQAEGDPLVKGKIKSLQFAAAKRRMMKDIPTADVVITNPTHYAIALKYNPRKKSSPIVVAKGVDEVAQRIKKVAMEHNVPLHEDRELARSLYKMCDIGDEIPAALFHAVAKVLAYIFSLKNKKKRKSIA
jgi:flagellar biosynthesis protein FlhB